MARIPMARITGARFDRDSIVRVPMNGDNWNMTWAADDTQLAGLCDGMGPEADPGKLHNALLLRLEGGPTEVVVTPLAGYPPLHEPITNVGKVRIPPRYYGFGILAIGDTIYQFCSTFDRQLHPDTDQFFFYGVKLISSPDGGVTWHNQDGSTPVVWEDWDDRSRETMLFFDEPQLAFSLTSVVQMGRAYADNEDGYVYVYAPNGTTDGTMNQLVMFRVPVDRVLDRDAYEYFEGRDADGSARWTADIARRGVVHTFPEGWVTQKMHPYSWQPSLAYVPALGRYLMTAWGTGGDESGWWFRKPSYFGLWSSETPWGPWEQFHEDTAWLPGGDERDRGYQPQFAPRWIAEDGRSFWLVWTDYGDHADEPSESFAEVTARGGTPEEFADAFVRHSQYYAFNAQRVDLDVS
jgi:hypothetical protein